MLPMFYESITALNTTAHHDAFLEPVKDYSFAKKSSTIAVGVSEFVQASYEYPVIFIRNDDNVTPMVLTGLKGQTNTFVAEDDGRWLGNYLPAYVRRYPFVLAKGKDEILTVCIDETYSGFNRAGLGEKLFDEEQRSQYLEGQISFLQAFEEEMQRTKKFCDYLLEFDLLEDSIAYVERKDEEPHNIRGFFVVSRERLNKLSAKDLKKLQKVGALELIYQHLSSLSQFDTLLNKDRQTS